MSERSWTIETICEALSSPAAKQRFLSEINRAPVHEIVTVFAKWQRIAADLAAAAERGRELARVEAETGEIPGEWIDVTDRIQAEAAAARARGVA
ncbi:hypothetical protein [Streptomyces gobiensis]|uniref:hypothetical protein n=1 Tax=Streptomyces gobiensis TaxID=2875706 RepID=UPI001E543B8A|nr:hypothetical protein [Streptomyces gobiensis]UGY92574.1 hypothetical protein test1122_13150 [Streptomyces gobiensis]